MKNEYRELICKQQLEFNEFPKMAAFDNEQFKEGKIKLGVKKDNEILSLGMGLFIRRVDYPAYLELVNKQRKERKERMQDPAFVYSMFYTEMAEHEYCITMDLRDTLCACELTLEDLNKNPMFFEQLAKAKEDYLREVC